MMTAYEKELLGMAVEACPQHDFSVWEFDGGWSVSAGLGGEAAGETLADALTALLTDLGVEVPERPSAERVQDLRSNFIDAVSLMGAYDVIDREAPRTYAREPLTVLALLERGAS